MFTSVFESLPVKQETSCTVILPLRSECSTSNASKPDIAIKYLNLGAGAIFDWFESRASQSSCRYTLPSGRLLPIDYDNKLRRNAIKSALTALHFCWLSQFSQPKQLNWTCWQEFCKILLLKVANFLPYHGIKQMRFPAAATVDCFNNDALQREINRRETLVTVSLLARLSVKGT